MKHLIQATNAFRSLEIIAQKMINKRTSQVQIQDAIIQARNIGIEKWRDQTDLPNRWKGIVEEIILNENEK